MESRSPNSKIPTKKKSKQIDVASEGLRKKYEPKTFAMRNLKNTTPQRKKPTTLDKPKTLPKKPARVWINAKEATGDRMSSNDLIKTYSEDDEDSSSDQTDKDEEEKKLILDKFSDHDLSLGQLNRVPTLRVTLRKGVYRVSFQPIRLDPRLPPLLPVEFILPDVWSDEEPTPPSDESDLEIEYLAPAAFVNRTVKKTPLIQSMKGMYDYTEVEKHFADIRAAKEAEEMEANSNGSKENGKKRRKKGTEDSTFSSKSVLE